MSEEKYDSKLHWDDDIDISNIYEDLEIDTDKSTNMDILLASISSSFSNEEILNSSLKRWFSGIILIILSILSLTICIIVILQGIGIFKIEEWTLRIFTTSVIVEIIALVRIMVKSLFPQDDRKIYLDFIKNIAGINTNEQK